MPVPRWDDPSQTFVVDDALACKGESIRELDEAVTRRQYGYASVDDYYAAASSDQRLAHIGGGADSVDEHGDRWEGRRADNRTAAGQIQSERTG